MDILIREGLGDPEIEDTSEIIWLLVLSPLRCFSCLCHLHYNQHRDDVITLAMLTLSPTATRGMLYNRSDVNTVYDRLV